MAVDAAVSVSTLVAGALPLTEEFEKLPVTPLGSPETESAMAELKPLEGVVVSVTWPLVPLGTLTDVALAASVKVGAGTTTEMVCFAVWPPPAAVTVRV